MRLVDASDVVVEERHARIVHQHVDVAEVVEGLRGEIVHGVPVGHVSGDREGASARLPFHFLRERLARVLLPARDHDIGAYARERHDHLLAETAAATGDEGDLAVQAEGVGRIGGHRILRSSSWLVGRWQ